MSAEQILKLRGISPLGLDTNYGLGYRQPLKVRTNHKSRNVKAFSDTMVVAKELETGSAEPDSSEADEIGRLDSTGSGDESGDLYTPEGPDNGGKKKNRQSLASRKRRRLIIGGAGGLGAFLLIILVIIMAGSFKVIHFSQILIGSGYARLNGIVQERTTQDIFDSSVVEGPGSADLKGRTLIDRLKFRNVELELAKMGRAGDFSLLNDGSGSTYGFKIKDTTVDLNQISREFNFGSEYKNIKPREKLTVRKAFVDRGQTAMADLQATESRVIRTHATSIVADNVGFKWARWRQAFREKFGSSPNPTDAEIQDRLDQEALTNAQNNTLTDIPEIDSIIKDAKNPEKLAEILKKSGGELDPAAISKSLAADAKNAAAIGDAATTASTAALILSIDCMANQTFAHYSEVAIGNEKQASLVGLNLAAANSQIKAGVTTGTLVGSAAKQLDGAQLAPDYQSQFGAQGDTHVNIPKLKTDKNVDVLKRATSPSGLATGGVTTLLGALGIGSRFSDAADKAICQAILSPAGVIGIAISDIALQAVVDAFSGGGGTIAEQAGGRSAAFFFIKTLASATWHTAADLVTTDAAKTVATVSLFALYGLGLQYVAESLAGTAINGGGHGADYYETAYAGTRAVQNREVRSVSYGRPLSNKEAVAVDINYNGRAKDKWLKQGAMNRYFAIANPYSITGSIFAAVPTSLSSWSSKAGSIFTNVGNILNGSIFKKSLAPAFATINQRAFAQTPPVDDAKFGLTPWGFSPDELDKMANDASYGIGENEKHISQDEIKHYDDTIGKKCYDPAKTQYEIGKEDDCSDTALKQPQVLRYRIYKLDTSVVNMTVGSEGAQT